MSLLNKFELKELDKRTPDTFFFNTQFDKVTEPRLSNLYSETKEYSYEVKIGVRFTAPDSAVAYSLKIAKEKIMRELYEDVLRNLEDLTFAVLEGDREKCFNILNKTKKEITEVEWGNK